MRRLGLAVEIAIGAALALLVVLTRRNGSQILALSFGNHIRASGIAVSVAAAAGVVAWAAVARGRSATVVVTAGGIGIACALGAARLSSLPDWFTVLVDACWLAGPSLVLALVALCATDYRHLQRRQAMILGAIATSGVAAALLDRGAGLGATIGTLSSTDVPAEARVALAVHLVLLVIGGVRLAIDSTTRKQLGLVLAATAWFVSTLSERLVYLLPISRFRDFATDSFQPWAMIVGVYLPMVTCGAFLAVIGWSLAVRPAVIAAPAGVLVLRDQDPIILLRDDIASWLGDPTLELAFADPAGGWVGANGAVTVDRFRYDRATTVLTRDDQPVGLFIHDLALASAPETLATAGALAALALDANQLLAVSEGRLAEAHRLSARLLATDSSTRSEVSDLVETGPLARLRKSADAITFGAPLADLLPELRLATSEVRALSHGILPPELSSEGLRSVLADRSGVPKRRLPTATEITAYLIGRDDPTATFEDRGTTLRIHRGTGTCSPVVRDRIAVLGGVVDDDTIDLPIHEH